MIKLLLIHTILDTCIDNFFNTLASNFNRVLIKANNKYTHVEVYNIPKRNEVMLFYGVTFYVNDDGSSDQYTFTYDTYIHKYFFDTRFEATEMLESIKLTTLYNDPSVQAKDAWIDQLSHDLYVLCFDRSYYRNTSLNPDFYTVKIIQ